jgi:hypothetical protein
MGPIVHWLQTCHDLVVSKLMKMTRKAVTIGLCPYIDFTGVRLSCDGVGMFES